MVQAGDRGRDYEHCLALQRKLDDVDSDMRVDDMRIKGINTLADKLIRQGRSDTRTVQQRRDNFNSKWKALQGALTEYREHLAGALEIHSFNRDVDDTLQRVSEKSVSMASDDTGKDLAACEQLKRKQDALERDMTAIEGKLKVVIRFQMIKTSSSFFPLFKTLFALNLLFTPILLLFSGTRWRMSSISRKIPRHGFAYQNTAD